MDNLKVSIDFLEFPPAHTCDGQNLSPKITIQGLESTSVAVMVFNPSVRNVVSYCAWLIWNLPPNRSYRRASPTAEPSSRLSRPCRAPTMPVRSGIPGPVPCPARCTATCSGSTVSMISSRFPEGQRSTNSAAPCTAISSSMGIRQELRRGYPRTRCRSERGAAITTLM